ncbi:unnamed protein product [Symbiodinium sp. CCMP2592]|nr:unnamed protein product [Symbiodinium sp. CCMP2592]
MARRPVLGSVALAAALAVALHGLCQWAFVAPAPGRAGISQTGARVSGKPDAFAQPGSVLATACGVAGSAALLALASRSSRVAVRANPGSPSLIQVLEQKGLLSTVENLGLLSGAEKAGIKVSTVEELGLLKLAERLNLLSLAENVLTNGSTPFLMLAGAGVLAAGSFLCATNPEGSFFQYFLTGALGAPALVLGGAALVILLIFGGTRRTRSIDVTEKEVSYGEGGFQSQEVLRSASLLETVEQKKLLSFLEENRLLSLAGSLVDRPLTLTENLKLLSTLESLGVLSQVESLAASKGGGALPGLGGLVLLGAALAALTLLPSYGVLVALLLALPGLAGVALGVGIGLIKPPVRGEAFSN